MQNQQALVLIQQHISDTVTPQHQRDRLKKIEEFLSNPDSGITVNEAVALIRAEREDTITPQYQRDWLRQAEELLAE
jgi:hypothetical protein